MTLRDIEGVFPSGINVIIVPYNEGYGFDNDVDVLYKGKLGDPDLLDYYNINIVGLKVIDKSTIILSMDDYELEYVVIKKKFDHYKPKVEKMLNEGYTVEQTLGCIYGLYSDYAINEATECALYDVADPEDKCDKAPADCWDKIGFDNPLL